MLSLFQWAPMSVFPHTNSDLEDVGLWLFGMVGKSSAEAQAGVGVGLRQRRKTDLLVVLAQFERGNTTTTTTK